MTENTKQAGAMICTVESDKDHLLSRENFKKGGTCEGQVSRCCQSAGQVHSFVFWH